MATMFGRFEIQSQLSKSETALIYKAMDTETNQVVALKTQSLEPLGDRAAAFVETLLAEGESTRDIAGQNIVLLYGAGEIDGQFCAAMEYIQGNSIATMIARKEGFSIWDLLDITRQVCAGLECASAKNVTHCSLEPAKVMVQWDGMVKILGYGISNMSLIDAESGKGLGQIMPYCSPEQIRGEAIDLRSNLFSLGAILYEMVAGHKAFEAEDPVALLSQIENDMPPSPASENAKINPAVSALIMKALAKDPGERYQNAHELLEDLERCKETGKKTVTETKKKAPLPNIAVSSAARAAAASKFLSTATSAAKPAPAPRPVSPRPVMPVIEAPKFTQTDPAAGDSMAAAVAAPGGSASPFTNVNSGSNYGSKYGSRSGLKTGSNLNTGARVIGESDASASASEAAPGPVLSAAVLDEETEQQAPRGAVDPIMSEPAAGSSGLSFSDLAEMPPLKEPVFAPPPPPEEPLEPSHPVKQIIPREEEKPKIQPREVAAKAYKEISSVPPRLMLYSILGAVGLILVIAIALYFHVHSEDDGSTAAPRPVKSENSNSNQPDTQTSWTTQAAAPAASVEPITDTEPDLTVRQVDKHGANHGRRASAPATAPVVMPGMALIDSNPQGAQFQVDGRSDPSWVTPFTLANLSPGKHIISANKSGYSSEIRSVEVYAGSKSSLVLSLSPINALLGVNSTPPGAEVVIDGRPTGRVTPIQFAVEKGSHTVLVRKQGYLEETTTTDLGPGQNFQYSPVLRALGNADDIRTVGKLNKFFGHGGDSAAGMGSISVQTKPKGAQIAINQRILDKMSPVNVVLGPGNYIVDVTMTGFKPIHKVVNVGQGGKVLIDEILERQ